MGSTVKPRYEHDDWFEQYSVTNKPKSTGLPSTTFPIDSYPYASGDSISSASAEPSVHQSFKIDQFINTTVPTVLSAGGVSVYLGPSRLDDKAGQAIDIRAPEQMFQYVPPWLAEVRRTEEAERARKRKDAELAPGNGGLLAALGRFVTTPIFKALRLFEKAFNLLEKPLMGILAALSSLSQRALSGALIVMDRVVLPVWNPLDRMLVRATNWIGKQIDRAYAPLEKAFQYVKSKGKKMLDTLLSRLEQAPKRVSGWLDQAINYLWS